MKIQRKVVVGINPIKHVMEVRGNRSTGFSLLGIEGRLLQIISDVLDFELNFVLSVDGEWGRETPNGSWTGLLGMLQRNEADLAMSFLKVTEDTLTVTDACKPHLHEPIRFIVGKPKAQATSVALLKTFDVAVWIGVVATLLFLPFIFKILLKESFVNSFLQFVGNLLKQPTTIPITSKMHALLLSFWWFFALVVSFSYSAAVLSFLSYPLDQKAIRKFEDLSEAVRKGTHRCLTLRGTTLTDVLKRSENPNLRDLGKTMEQNSWHFDVGQVLTEKEFGSTAIMDLEFMLKVNYGFLFDNSIFLSTDNQEASFTAISINKRFCCKNAMNTVLSRVQSSGIFSKIINDELVLNWISENHKTNVKPKSGAVTLDDVRGPFLILFGGYIIGTLSLISERVHYILYKIGKNV